MATTSKKNSRRRSMQWRRIDLHIHTPASSLCYKDPHVTMLQILQKAEEKNLSIIAITDHNTVKGYAAMVKEIEALELLERLDRLMPAEKSTLDEYRRLRSKILVLPGFEFTATLGFHILGIFSEQTSVRRLEHILLELRVPEECLETGQCEVGATTDVLTSYQKIANAGGLVIAAHVNSSHGVALTAYDFGGQTKISNTQDRNLHALEVTDFDSSRRRNTASFFNGSKPEYPRRMHCIQGSDAHRLVRDPSEKQENWGVGDRVTEVLLDEVSFEALKEIFLGTDFSRTRPCRTTTQAPIDQIKMARKIGPNIVQSFHEYFPAKASKRLEILKEINAFANTNGGTIYIGASANAKHAPRGVEKPEEAVAWLQSEVKKNLTPPIDLNIEVKTSEGKSVVVVEVPQGPETPYTLGSGQVFVRQESETSLALRDEIVRLVEKSKRGGSLVVANVEGNDADPLPSVAEDQPIVLSVAPPKTGAEIVEAEERDGVMYYGIKDLRNGNIIRNVTRFSTRHLWHYAITQREDHPLSAEEVTWLGDIGLWKSYTRSGTKRYNLAQRDGNGTIHVYYGVTEEGIHGQWRSLFSEKVSASTFAQEEP